MADDWSPEKCACRWGEQPCGRCLPVLDARFRARQKIRPKREWGKAPARIYADRFWTWTWECRIDACTTVAPREAEAWHTTQAGALTALAEHQEAEHVDAMFRGDRGGPLGMAMDRTSERSGA